MRLFNSLMRPSVLSSLFIRSSSRRRRNNRKELCHGGLESLEDRRLLTSFDYDDQISEAFSIGQLSSETYERTMYITERTDVDLFAFDAQAGQEISATVVAYHPLTPRLRVFGPAGINGNRLPQELGFAFDGNTLTLPVRETGRYYIGVSELSNFSYSIFSGGPDIVSPGATTGKYTVFLADTAGGPDLLGSDFNVEADTASSGDDLQINYAVRNKGNARSDKFTVSFYASTNKTITTYDTLLGRVTMSGISAGRSRSDSARFRLPESFTDSDGSIYVGMIIDSGSDVSETDESNNRNEGLGRDHDGVKLAAAKPDLLAKSLSADVGSLKPGQSIDLTFEVQNSAQAGAGEFKVSFFASTNQTISKYDAPLGHRTISGLAAGASTGRLTLQVTLPEDFRDTDEFFSIGMIVDFENDVAEDNETNNRNLGSDTDRVDLNLQPAVVDPPPRPVLREADDTEDLTPEFLWETVDGAEQYELWVSNLTTGRRVLHRTDLTEARFTPNEEMTPGRIRFWVRARNAGGWSKWSRAEDFLLGVAPPQRAVMTGPESGADRTPTITWQRTSGADRYEVWVTNLDTGTRAVHNRSVTGESYTGTEELSDGRYRAWVRAGNGAGWGKWSRPLNFNVAAQPVPLQGTVLGPSDTNSRTPVFNWASLQSADRYELWVTHVDTGNVVIHDSNLRSTSASFSELLPTGRFRVWVRGGNAAGWGAWSRALVLRIG